jgi:hypothetical protein
MKRGGMLKDDIHVCGYVSKDVHCVVSCTTTESLDTEYRIVKLPIAG